MKLTTLALTATLLTALGLHPTLHGSWWFWASVICSVAAVGGCALARLLGLPRPVVPLAGLLALILAVTQFSARDTAVFGILPGPGAVHQYINLMHRAFHFINISVPPAPNKASLVALVAGSVGLVALLVDTFAVTYRASALAGLPLLALYGVPVAVVRDGVPWQYFALGALGWMALVLAEGHERVGSWGRTIRRATEDPKAGRLVGRRIGAAALGLAIIVPAFLPGIGDGVLDAHRGKGGGNGGRVLTVNPYVSLAASLNQPQNAEVLDYRTTDTNPGYITLVTLDTFKADTATWIPSGLTSSGTVGTDTLPPLTITPGVASDVVSATFHADGLQKSTWLPTPTPLLSVTADEKWVYDNDHRIPWTSTNDINGLTYTTKSLDVQPTAAQLEKVPATPSNILRTFTALPSGIDPEVRTIAEELTKNAKTPFDKAVALQAYFQDNFSYNAAYRSPKKDALVAFLAAKQGFCQQFAGTFAVMARQLGLPTRVVVGFLPGHRTDVSDPNSAWTVYWRDTHAWPEVYFSGLGWVRFEPTPRTDDTGLTVPDYTVGTTSTQASGSIAVPFPSNKEPKLGDTHDTTSASASGGSSWWSPGHFVSRLPWTWLLGTILVVLLVALPGLVRRFLRRRRLDLAADGAPVDAALAAWQELEATCVDLGVVWPASRTPRQTAAALTPEVAGTAGPALARLGLATERAQFARTPVLTRGLDVDVSAVRLALLERRSTGQRLRADVLPRSVLSRVGAAMADLLDRFDDLVSARPWRKD